LLKVVQAGKVEARVGEKLYRIPDGTLRALRALYRVSVCELPLSSHE